MEAHLGLLCGLGVLSFCASAIAEPLLIVQLAAETGKVSAKEN